MSLKNTKRWVAAWILIMAAFSGFVAWQYHAGTTDLRLAILTVMVKIFVGAAILIVVSAVLWAIGQFLPGND